MPHMLNSDLINMLILNGQTANPPAASTTSYSTHPTASIHQSIVDGLIQQQQQFTAYQQSLVVARLNELMARPNMQVNAIAALLASILNTTTTGSQSNATPSNAGSNGHMSNNSGGANNKMNLSRYKTELCRQFTETGECKYGDKCQFAHGEPDLKKVPRHPKYKTDLCKTFHSKGFCPYGPRCHFLHELDDEIRSVNESTGFNNSPISNSMSSLLNMSPASTPSTRSPSSSSHLDVFSSSSSSMLDSMPQTPVRSRSTASNYPSTSSSSTCDFFHTTTPESTSSLLDSSNLSMDSTMPSGAAHIQQFNLFNTVQHSAMSSLPHMAFTQGFKW